MKIACSGDLHIGVPRRALAERVLVEMVDDMIAKGADVIALPGDIFDSMPSPSEMLFLRSLLAKVPQHVKVLIIPGNHDPHLTLSIVDAFGANDPFSGSNVIVCSDPDVLSVEVGDETLGVVCLPELRGTWLKKKMGEKPGSTAIDIARDTLDGLGRRAATFQGPVLFMAHLTIGGARMDNDQPARTPELAFLLEDLKRVRAHAYALGHVHVAQRWDLDNAFAFYTGSPFGNTWGELGQKTWTMLTWDGSGFQMEQIPTTAPRLILLSGTWSRTVDVAAMTLAYHKVHKTDRVVALEDLAGAEVLLRYDVPSDDKSACEPAAKAHREAILGAGALLCDLDPLAVVTARSRGVSLASARTIPEKIDAYYEAKDERPGPERRERIRAIVAKHEPALPPSPPVSLVRVNRVTWQSVGKLVPEGSFEPTKGVRVVIGPNEVGKSTLLSLFYVGMWRDGPKGTLTALSNGEAPRVKIDITTAMGSWEIEQESNKATVWENGEPIVSGRAAVADWAKKNLPSPSVLRYTSFLPSEEKGLLGLYDTALKQALLTLSGATVYASLASLVAEDAKEARATTKSLSAMLARAGDPHAMLRGSLSAGQVAAQRVFALRSEKMAVDDALALLAEHQTKRADLKSVRADLDDVKRRIVEADFVIANTMQDMQASFDRDRISTALAALQSDNRAASVKQEALKLEREHVEAQVARARGRVEHHRAHARRLAERLKERTASEAAEQELPAVMERLAQAEASVEEAARAQDVASPRVTLTEVVSIARNARLQSSIQTSHAAFRQIIDKGEETLSTSPRAASATLSAALAHRSTVQSERDKLTEKIAKLSTFEEVEQERVLAEQNADTEEEGLFSLTVRVQDIEEQEVELAEQVERLQAHIVEHTKEFSRLNDIVSKAEDAERRGRQAVGEVRVLNDLRTSLEECVRNLEIEVHELDTKTTAMMSAWPYGLEPTKARAAILAREIEDAERDVYRIETRVEVQRAAAEKYDADVLALALAERTEGDLDELLRVLSPKCIQAFEADEIGIEIADLATELLQRHGFRWTMSYSSLRGDVEQARWMLTDLDTGKSFDARAKGGGASDGQAFIVMTAIFWAAREAVCRRGGGVDDSSVSLDEMAGAVREHNVNRWLSMMRDGLERTRGKALLFIPPNDAKLIDACDGAVTVRATSRGSVVE